MRSAPFYGSCVFPPWLLESSEERVNLMRVISSVEVLERTLQVFVTRWLNVESEFGD